ncbi:MAG: phosphonoacetaldehyde reductase [Thiotrichales bacterium]|nr:phosphonoacetaldehyde reductase [Thiotrichales bacterium]
MSNLKNIIDKHNAKRVLIVAGKKSFSLSGAQVKIKKILSNIEITLFNDFQSNPKIEDVMNGMQLVYLENPDLIISIGGGSVLDMAKLINILAAQDHSNILDVIKKPDLINKRGVPLVAIPTTAGSGSQSTHFAVVYVDNIKYSVAHNFVMPDYAIVDAELAYSLPKYIAASSGIDALSQAVESYWAIKSTDESKKYSSEAISLIIHALQKSVAGDRQAIGIMSKAAHLAGKAINITTTTAPHAISYPITIFFGVPHGHAVALTLGYFFEINSNIKKYKVLDPRGEDYLLKTMHELFDMFGSKNAKECFFIWQDIIKSIGLELSFNKIGINSQSDKKMVTNNVNFQRLDNNPVKVNSKIIREVILELNPRLNTRVDKIY